MMPRRKTLFLAGALAVAGCYTSDELTAPDDLPATSRCYPLAMRSDLLWSGTNDATLTTWLDSRGCASASYDPAKKPVALFDWDNTILKNDIGDAITFHLITHDQILQPPNQDWKLTSGYMTDAGAAALTAACGTTVPAGKPLPTSTNLACAHEIL